MIVRNDFKESANEGTLLMKFSLSHDFPVSLDVLWPVYGDATYLEAKYKALGSTHLRILESVVTEKQINVVLERTVSANINGIPDWAQKMISHDYVMRHENHCERPTPHQALVSLHITPLGSPVNIHGRGSLSEPAPGKTHLALTFEVECRIPVLGKKIAGLFAEKIKEALNEDYEFTVGYIAGKRE
jgi:hypothetical protein